MEDLVGYIKQDSCCEVKSVETEFGKDWHVNIPKGKRWLSEVFTSIPKGYFIDKTTTGSGGTTLALTEDTKMVVVVPRVMLVKNKVDQHKGLVGVHGGVSQSELVSKIDSKKFICTYDSLVRLMDTFVECGIDCSEYHLLVDEIHTVIREGGDFRSDVCNRLLNRVDEFKSTTYLTATPTKRKYLPPSLANVPLLKLNWDGESNVKIMKCKVGTDLNTKIASIVVDCIDSDKGVPFLFYNSLTGIISLIKLLQKVRKIGREDIKIICADNEANRARLRKELGKDWIPEAPVTVDEHGTQLQETHKVVFITRACFEGLDIYCERAYTIIVSDAKRKHKDHVKLDIAIDLPQIIGRFRDQCEENKKQVVFVWTEAFASEVRTEEEFEMMVKKQISEVPEAIRKGEEGWAGIGGSVLDALKSTVYTTEAEGQLEVNPLAYYAMMNAYEAVNRDYVVLLDSDDKGEGEHKLDRLFDTNNTYVIPPLSIQDKKTMERSISYQKLLKEYCETLEMLEDGCDEEQEAKLNSSKEYYEQIAPDLPDIVQELGLEKIKGYGYQWRTVGKLFRNAVGIKSLRVNKAKTLDSVGVRVGEFYSMKYLKDSFQKLYDAHEIETTAKATDVLDYFVCKKTTQRNQAGYLILGEQ